MGRYPMNSACTNQTCPVENAPDMIGAKWKNAILYRRLYGKCFGELQRMGRHAIQGAFIIPLRFLE